MLLTIPVLSYQFDLNVELFNFKVFNKHLQSKFKKNRLFKKWFKDIHNYNNRNFSTDLLVNIIC